MQVTPPARRWQLAVAIGLAALVLTRIRGQIAAVRLMHAWLAEHGVPLAVRSLDSALLLLCGALLGARLAAGRGRTLAALGLRGSLREGLRFGCLAGLPMLLQAALASDGLRLTLEIVRGVLVMPFVEEVFFRGLLVAIPVALGGVRFWPCAIASGVVFGALHVPWDQSLAWDHAPQFAVTTIAGVWYAWLCRCFGWSLWPTIVLHAVMNGAWAVFAVAENAAGAFWPNIGRALTITLGTVLALRRRRRGATA